MSEDDGKEHFDGETEPDGRRSRLHRPEVPGYDASGGVIDTSIGRADETEDAGVDDVAYHHAVGAELAHIAHGDCVVDDVPRRNFVNAV